MNVYESVGGGGVVVSRLRSDKCCLKSKVADSVVENGNICAAFCYFSHDGCRASSFGVMHSWLSGGSEGGRRQRLDSQIPVVGKT